MKIGILTFHSCINYGSYWQARCLAEELINRGHDTVILNHQSKRVNFSEWKCALQPVLPTPVPKSDVPFYRKKIENFFCSFESLPLSHPFSLENPQQMDQYDMVIVGSDEVWNLSHPWYGYYPIFYGDGIKANRVISYAASFGNYDVTWKPDQIWLNKLQKFDKISVRDENSQTIIRNTLGIEPEMVLDPCLQFPPKTDILESHPFTGTYAAVYGHNFSDFYIQNVLQWSKETKIPLISIGYRNDWANDQWLAAGPHEFASFIAQSNAVITNFFHGCVFALNNSKPFVTEITPYRSHKVQDLMKKAGAEKHIVTETTPDNIYKFLLNNPLEEVIHKNLTYLRYASNAWLNKVMVNTSNYYEKV